MFLSSLAKVRKTIFPRICSDNQKYSRGCLSSGIINILGDFTIHSVSSIRVVAEHDKCFLKVVQCTVTKYGKH